MCVLWHQKLRRIVREWYRFKSIRGFIYLVVGATSPIITHPHNEIFEFLLLNKSF